MLFKWTIHKEDSLNFPSETPDNLWRPWRHQNISLVTLLLWPLYWRHRKPSVHSMICVNKIIFMIKLFSSLFKYQAVFWRNKKIKEVDIYNVTIKQEFAPLLFGCNGYRASQSTCNWVYTCSLQGFRVISTWTHFLMPFGSAVLANSCYAVEKLWPLKIGYGAILLCSTAWKISCCS